jgi:hypothetical protein
LKTAIIVAGVCRFTDLTHKSWNIFPEADWYLSTWDISQRPYSPIATSSKKEISTIKHLFDEILISNYQTEYLDTKFQAYDRPFILLEKIFDKIKDKNYNRVIYFRPDLMLYTLENFLQQELEVDDNTIKILDCHGPDFWIMHNSRTMQDSFLVFSWKKFELFINSRRELCKYSIHKTLYNFIEKHQINVIPLYNMKSVIIRENAYKYKNDLTWENLTLAFGEIYTKNDYIGKFPKRIELTIEREPDYEKIRMSQATGGILKLRNK